jgi:hypothetical protein
VSADLLQVAACGCRWNLHFRQVHHPVLQAVGYLPDR